MKEVLSAFLHVPELAQAAIMLVLAYLAGCFNAGYYLVRWLKKGADIREFGSGTAGATNTGRVLGRQGFLVVLLLDGAKAILAVLLARWLQQPPLVLSLTAFAVVAGHIFPVQLKFRGGKGIAPALGGVIASTPLLWLYMMGVWIVLVAVLRRYHLSGVLAIASLPLMCLLTGLDKGYCVGFFLLALLLFIRSVPDLKRRAATGQEQADESAQRPASHS